MNDHMLNMTPVESRVYRLLNGIDTRERTPSEIAGELCVSVETVRRIAATAARKITH